jgi:hypothetical protein
MKTLNTLEPQEFPYYADAGISIILSPLPRVIFRSFDLKMTRSQPKAEHRKSYAQIYMARPRESLNGRGGKSAGDAVAKAEAVQKLSVSAWRVHQGKVDLG